VVAGNVHSSQDKSKVILRDTTLMPTLPGMLPIVSMLFAPKIELRTKPGVDHYTGMICGLGYDKRKKAPFYPEHDMELVFDTAFSLADLQEVLFDEDSFLEIFVDKLFYRSTD
jgi:ATP-dependent RNA helicase TDRD9